MVTLKTKQEFDSVYKSQKRWHDTYFILFFKEGTQKGYLRKGHIKSYLQHLQFIGDKCVNSFNGFSKINAKDPTSFFFKRLESIEVSNDLQYNRRVGFSVSKKVGNAVCRNRIKRRLRSLYQEFLPKLKEGDMVLLAREGLDKVSYKTLCSGYKYALERLNLIDKAKLR